MVHFNFTYTSKPPMSRTACTEPQCLYNDALYHTLPFICDILNVNACVSGLPEVALYVGKWENKWEFIEWTSRGQIWNIILTPPPFFLEGTEGNHEILKIF